MICVLPLKALKNGRLCGTDGGFEVKLYDLLWQVAETLSEGKDTEGLYQYFLHTSIDFDDYVKTVQFWSAAPVPDREIPELDKIRVFLFNKSDDGCASFVVGDDGETDTKMIMFCIDDYQLFRYLDANRQLWRTVNTISTKNMYQIPLNGSKSV